jgi:hypothetical protein
MLRLIFKIFKKRFIRYLNKEGGIKMTVNNLVFAFHDLEGNAYYRFPKEVELPIIRTAKVQEFLMWLIKGVSKEEYLRAIDVAENALIKGISDQKGTAKIGFVLQELKDRCNMVLHDELFYNIIAAQLIRADESLAQFNNEIHMQKVQALKEMDIMDDGFFLAIRELLVPLGLLNITKEQLVVLLKESQANRKAMERMLSSL